MSALLKTSFLPQERRRHARVKVAIDGRLMLEDKQEHPCQTVDMSPGGILLRTPGKGHVTEKVVVYLDHFGRVEGMIVRTISDGFAIKMALTPVKLDRVADLLTWLANRVGGIEEDRRHARIIPRQLETSIQAPNGPAVAARIIDISVSGAGVLVTRYPAIGTRILIGQTPCKVVRHLDNGIAVEFLRLVPSENFDEDIIL